MAVALPPGSLRAAVLSDTHLTTNRSGLSGLRRRLPDQVWERLRQADVILHAGDILDQGVLDMLAEVAPVHAVLGNNDLGLVGRLPVTVDLELGGVRLAMVHDSGSQKGRAGRLHRRFPDAQVVVFGHSHIPVDQEGEGGQLLFNPGSPTQRRAQPAHTMGELVLGQGRVLSHQLVVLG